MRSAHRWRAPLVAPLFGAVFLTLAALTFVPASPSQVAASDPTLDAALYAIAQRTLWAGQTRDAREAELTAQRITATAQALEALRQARTATAVAEETRAAETRVARTATAVAEETRAAETRGARMATAVAEETRAAETRIAQTAAAETRAAETRAAYTATAVAVAARRAEESAIRTATVHAEQTRVAQEHALFVAAQREAQARFIGTGLIVFLLAGALVAAIASSVRSFWLARHPVIVEPVATSQRATVADEKDASNGHPSGFANSLPPTQVVFSAAATQEILDLIGMSHDVPDCKHARPIE